MSNERTLIGSAVEDLVFEISFWVVFYPYTLVRLLFSPKTTIARYMINVRRMRDPIPIVRAPVMLLITVAIDLLLGELIGSQDAGRFIKLAQLMNVPGGLVPLVDGSIFYIALAICNAVLIEAATPGGVTRDSFRPALMGNMLIIAPMLYGDIAASAILYWYPMDGDLNDPVQLRDALIAITMATGVGLVTLIYYLRSQAIQYRLLHAGGRWQSILLPTVALMVCALFLSILPEILTPGPRDKSPAAMNKSGPEIDRQVGPGRAAPR